MFILKSFIPRLGRKISLFQKKVDTKWTRNPKKGTSNYGAKLFQDAFGFLCVLIL